MNELEKAKNDLTPSLQERADHREWVGGRALTLLSHYWRDDDPVQLTAAIGADWADVLEDLPRDLIQRACIKYLEDEPRRRPTPGAIYEIAQSFRPKWSKYGHLQPVEKMSREQSEAYLEHVRRDNINEDNRRVAEAILARTGFAKRISAGRDEC